MDDNAQKILDVLPEDGSKISGGQVLDKVDLSKSEFKKGKEWLRDNGMVELGRGRGGTISRIVGAVAPPEPKKLSKAEVMKIAREERQSKSRIRKQRDRLAEKALKEAEKEFPDATEITIQVWNVDLGMCYAYIWEGKKGSRRGGVKAYYV